MGPTLFNQFVITDCMFRYTLSTKEKKRKEKKTKQNTRLTTSIL